MPLQVAEPLGQNGFKLDLGRRSEVRALTRAYAEWGVSHGSVPVDVSNGRGTQTRNSSERARFPVAR
ncbi:MAG: hypothetical protein QOI01_3024 [Mycobacterium sp.]|jgi:hypothetical protein|nr:hypothetical protein [Mycobacterium sp.]